MREEISQLKTQITELKCPNPHFNGDRKVYGHWKECLLAKIDENPEWFINEERKLSHLMQHVVGLAFDVLSKKYCHSARQKARENNETLTFRAALAELDFIFRRNDPYEATAEMQQLHMEDDEDFADFFPRFMALHKRGAYAPKSNPEALSDERKALGELEFCFSSDSYIPVAARNKLGNPDHFSFEEYVDAAFEADLWRKTSPWTSRASSMDQDVDE